MAIGSAEWPTMACVSEGESGVPQNWRRPRPRFKHSRTGFSGDPAAFVQKPLDSLPAFAGTEGRGNDEVAMKPGPHTGIRMPDTRDPTGGTVIRLFRILALSLLAAVAGAGP